VQDDCFLVTFYVLRALFSTVVVSLSRPLYVIVALSFCATYKDRTIDRRMIKGAQTVWGTEGAKQGEGTCLLIFLRALNVFGVQSPAIKNRLAFG